MYPDVSSYVSRVTSRKRIRYMYPDVSYVYPECILDSFEIRVKYMQNVKMEFNRACKIRSGYIKIHQDTCILQDTRRIHAYIRIRILITNPPKLDNKPPQTPPGWGVVTPLKGFSVVCHGLVTARPWGGVAP